MGVDPKVDPSDWACFDGWYSSSKTPTYWAELNGEMSAINEHGEGAYFII